MKKTMSIMLCLVILLSTTIPVFAWNPGSRDSKINMNMSVSHYSENVYKLTFTLPSVVSGYGGTIYVETAGSRGSTEKKITFTPKAGVNTIYVDYSYNIGEIRFVVYHATQYDLAYTFAYPTSVTSSVHRVTAGEVTAQQVAMFLTASYGGGAFLVTKNFTFAIAPLMVAIAGAYPNYKTGTIQALQVGQGFASETTWYPSTKQCKIVIK